MTSPRSSTVLTPQIMLYAPPALCPRTIIFIAQNKGTLSPPLISLHNLLLPACKTPWPLVAHRLLLLICCFPQSQPFVSASSCVFLARDCWTHRHHLCKMGLGTQVAWCESFPFVCAPHCEFRRAQTIHQPAGVFVLQDTPSAPHTMVYASSINLFLSRYMRRKLKKRCMTHESNAHTIPTRVRALHCDWRLAWEHGCKIRKTELAKRKPDWDSIMATYEKAGALLGISPTSVDPNVAPLPWFTADAQWHHGRSTMCIHCFLCRTKCYLHWIQRCFRTIIPDAGREN